jgi:hypothetical protein
MNDKVVAPLCAEDVLRDVGYPGFVKSLFNRNNHQAQDFTHAILGIATETRELLYATDSVNGLEEQGDSGFYAQAIVVLAEEFTGEVFDYDAVDAAVTDLIVAGDEIGPQTVIDREHTDILDIAKRWVGYGRKPDVMDAAVKAVALHRYVARCATYGGHEEAKVVKANVTKLLGRYKGMTFNADHAINRDVVAERRGLEASAA